MKYTINVTKDDIEFGVTCDVERDPIVLAIKRALPHGTEVLVGGRIAKLRMPGAVHFEQVNLPNSVIDFVKAFDRGRDVKPFTFELEV